MERIISAERVEDILNVFGSFDQNLHIIEKEWNVCVTDRDAELKISGEPEDVVSAEKAVQNLLMLAARGETVDEQRVRYVIGMIRSGQEDQIRELDSGVVCITAKGRPVKPKTLGQKGVCAGHPREYRDARHRPRRYGQNVSRRGRGGGGLPRKER